MLTVGCPDGAGGFVDVAVFSDAGALLSEFHKTFGKRTGQDEPFSCSGTAIEKPSTITFFDVLVTRR